RNTTRSRYEDHDEDDFTSTRSSRRTTTNTTKNTRSDSTSTSSKSKSSPPPPKQEPVKEINLFDFDEPAIEVSNTPNGTNTFQNKNILDNSNDDDEWGTMQSATDDFDDFQSAPPPVTSTNSASLSGFSAPIQP